MSFETAAIAMTDPMSVDFEDTLFPDRLVALAFAPGGAILCGSARGGAEQSLGEPLDVRGAKASGRTTGSGPSLA